MGVQQLTEHMNTRHDSSHYDTTALKRTVRFASYKLVDTALSAECVRHQVYDGSVRYLYERLLAY
jgi:hypothetical protein